MFAKTEWSPPEERHAGVIAVSPATHTVGAGPVLCAVNLPPDATVRDLYHLFGCLEGYAGAETTTGSSATTGVVHFAAAACAEAALRLRQGFPFDESGTWPLQLQVQYGGGAPQRQWAPPAAAAQQQQWVHPAAASQPLTQPLGAVGRSSTVGTRVVQPVPQTAVSPQPRGGGGSGEIRTVHITQISGDIPEDAFRAHIDASFAAGEVLGATFRAAKLNTDSTTSMAWVGFATRAAACAGIATLARGINPDGSATRTSFARTEWMPPEVRHHPLRQQQW